jgi:hypothetical protein
MLRGQAGGPDAERLARHLEECGRCGEAVERLLADDAPRGALRRPPADAVPAEIDAVGRLVARLHGLR